MLRPITSAALAVLAFASVASAEIKDLLPRLPADVNAIVAVDVDTILNSPVGKAQEWGTRKDGAFPIIQMGATKGVLGSKVNLGTLDSTCEVGVFELSKPMSIAGIALSEGGVSDTLGTIPAAWSSRKIYYLGFDKQLLGISAPDDRQFAMRWARQQASISKPTISTYLQEAAVQANSRTPLVMALDTRDAIGMNKVRKALRADLARLTTLKDTSADDVAELLTNLQGITFRVQFKNELVAELVLDFSKSPAILVTAAGPLLKDVLTQNGMPLQEIDFWTASAEGNKLIFNGKLSVPSFLKIITLVEVGTPTSTEAPAGVESGKPVPPPADPRAATIAASQNYFKSVSAILDSFSQPSSAGAGAAWLKRASNRIDHLPMLNVDPELLEWGNSVSASLLNCSQQLAVGQTSINSKAAGAYAANVSPVYYQDGDANYQYNRDAQVRADHARQVANMTSVSQDERARVVAPVNALLAQTIATRAKMRATLVDRYKVEF